MSRFFSAIALASILVAGTGCVTSTKVASLKAADFSGEPKNIFIITNAGTEYGDEFYDGLKDRLTEIFSECGASSGFSRMPLLELDGSVHVRRAIEFNADYILSVRRNGGTQSDIGLFHVIYDVSLYDQKRRKIVWKARTDFYRGGLIIPARERGGALAIDLTNKMKEDGIFSACQKIKGSTWREVPY